MNLLTAFQENWNKKYASMSGRPVLLAVSGGIDSMVMAHLFKKANIPFGIAHCNFQLRGTEADKDEMLVRNWAAENGVLVHYVRFDTKGKTAEWKKGVQETARILRYEWLHDIQKAHSYAAIATAHHANDNAETLLINLFKGTGIAGLHGIRPQNQHIIRPLLFATREALILYAAQYTVPYREDSSNASDDYLRNAVRHHVIPAVEKYFSGAIVQVNESIQRFAEAEILYRKAIDAEKKKLMEKRGNDMYIPVLKLKKAVPLETICFELFHPYGFSSAQIPFIMSLLDAESGKYMASGTHRIIRNRDFLILTQNKTEESDLILVEKVPATVNTRQGTLRFSFTSKPGVIDRDKNVALIDSRQISFPLIVRPWKQGDYFYPINMGMKKKKLSKYFIDNKIPLHEKENVLVVECAKRIVWVAGMRMDERFKIKDTTTSVLAIKFEPYV